MRSQLGGPLGGPRVLLKRLREVMAETITPQERLDKIVTSIAANMVAEVCSLYVMRGDSTLELFATEGLNSEAVHQTTMRLDEGLVGLIAREAKPLSLSDAQTHPAFSYKPETGEEIFHSFLGVPILRAGQTLGVLVVQNKAYRAYSEEEVEALQTTSMVLAEMLATGELQTLAPPDTGIALRRPLFFQGQGQSETIGLGYAVLYEPRVVVENLIAEDIPAELRRLDEAIEGLRSSIDRLIDGGEDENHRHHANTRDILEAFRMFAYDRGWLGRMREAVLSGLTAEAAVERVQSDTRARMLRATDPYLRERLHDLDDLASRLLRQLVGEPHPAQSADPNKDVILIARHMGPAALLEFDRTRLRGLVLEEGGALSHVAIVARSLGIATVVQVPNVTGLVEPGDAVIVDGTSGEVHIRPTADVEAAYSEKVKFRARKQAQYAALRSMPSITRDGQKIDLLLNAGLIVDLSHVEESGAQGIGLFRTELQFMVSPKLPKASEQEALYAKVFDALGEKPVTFRTLDIGGDKHLPYMEAWDEPNPALGWRAIRLGLDKPGLLRTQVRALMKAAQGKPLKIMFPMISSPEEFDEAKALLNRELVHLEKHGHVVPRDVKVGAMLEVPSLLFCLDEMCARVDFLSVGSNDLVQFLFAIDRENLKVATRFDIFSAPVLRALLKITEACDKHHVPLTLCGEIGGKPLGAMALLGLGFRSLSMSPAAIGPVKAMLLSLDVQDLNAFLMDRLASVKHDFSLREWLKNYAAQHHIPL
jgi:phosphotransferase system, enzyme I, PtsP